MENPQHPPLEPLSDREPTSPALSIDRSPLSDLQGILDSLEIPSPEQLEAYGQTHQQALRVHQQQKAAEKAQADTAAKTPEGLDYAARLQAINQPVSRFETIMARVRQQIRIETRQQCMDFVEAKKIVAELMIVKLARENRTLYFTPEQKEVIADITAYFIGDTGSSIPLTKGVFLYGGVGVGKTFLLKIMASFCELAEINNMVFRKVSTKSLMQEVADANKLEPIRRHFTGHLLLDDLGEEKQDVKLWGNLENPMDLLISERYNAFQDKGFLTHATSNLMPKQLEAYGTRLFDRLSDMTHAVLLPGGSKRG